MKYGIAIFPPKKIQDVANSYRKRYDPHYALIPPHITLKEPFEAEDNKIKEMVPHLKEIAKETNPFDIEINKVSSFAPVTNAIYLKVEPAEVIMTINEKLEAKLPGKSEHSYVPHITIAQKLSDDEFSDVYGSLRMGGFELKETVDRFQLLYQLENGSWTVYETFVLGEG
ncbi:putative phosphoesterase YjcG [Thalassobacillus devorans]|uniref:Putative phosphoesterase GCM10007216_01960 n=1 Tax=Thalassobacillus devorans TaxID=279813 RepID=A0ABQ1NEX0_9BACI|nr:YjcG family protein [Thalassobacillus devorans]NIK27104.1 2'-5' RNA ligase [Thalassobacillus devorans]GGC74961.1 putative phosphoesterase YjcG [Thalassobacillus devorans]